MLLYRTLICSVVVTGPSKVVGKVDIFDLAWRIVTYGTGQSSAKDANAVVDDDGLGVAQATVVDVIESHIMDDQW